MKEDIIHNLDKPRQLEKLYRENKRTFKNDFNLIFQEIQNHPTAQIWNERLNFENEGISWGSKNELSFIIWASFIAGLVAKIPDFTAINAEFFFPRNVAFIVFPALAAYFSWRQNIQPKKLLIITVAILVSVFYINILPNNTKSDTLILACIHLPLFLWTVLGFAFVGDNLGITHKRLEFLRYNGDLFVMTTIILIAGALMTGITIVLFSLIEIEIDNFYFKYIVVWGLAASPIVGTYLIQTNPQLVNKVSPVIAKVFTPLVLATLVIYLFFAVFGTGRDPYNDREFLLIFNLLLIGVMVIILFSIAESSKRSNSTTGTILLQCLSLVTIIVNGIALSAILFRISEWGITPNRIAVFGGNILILTNLLLVSFRLFKMSRDRNEIENVEKSIATFLPIYSIWTIIVTFVFPIIFNFK
jgi:hypothetical protein